VPVDPDHEFVTDLLPGGGNTVLGVGPDRRVQPRVSRRDIAYPGKRCFIVGIWRHGKPDLPGVDIDDFVGGDRAANVRSCGLDTWRAAHFSGYRGGDPAHLGQGRAGRPLDADEHVAVLQRRQNRSTRSQPGDQDRRYGQYARAQRYPAGLGDRRRGNAIGSGAYPAIKRARPQMSTSVAEQQHSKRRRNDQRDKKGDHGRKQVRRNDGPAEGIRYSTDGQHRRQDQNCHHQGDE